MSHDFSWLRQLHESFDPAQATAWAREAHPTLVASLPLLSAESYRDGVPEALMELRILLDHFTPETAEQHAFDLCNRLEDLWDLLQSP
jgi:hypothetical protein